MLLFTTTCHSNRMFLNPTIVAATTRRWTAVRGFASVGDKLPSVDLHLNFPPKKYNLADFCKNKKVVLVGLPGAFTPT